MIRQGGLIKKNVYVISYICRANCEEICEVDMRHMMAFLNNNKDQRGYINEDKNKICTKSNRKDACG